MNRANGELAILQQLRHAQALWSSESKIHFLSNTQFKECEMFRTTNARNNQVQIMNLLRIDLDQRSGQEISLFLIVSLQYDPVSADQHSLESVDDPFFFDDQSLHPRFEQLHAPPLLIASGGPRTRNRY